MRTASPAQTIEVVIDRWHPTALNRLMHGHWATGARRKKVDRRIIEAYCYLAQVPPAAVKRRVTLTIVLGPGQRAPDPDSLWKSLLDGLTHCRALKNDSRQWVELMPVEFERGKEKGTRIVLEDVL